MRRKLSFVLCIFLILEIFIVRFPEVNAGSPLTKTITHTIVENSFSATKREGPTTYHYDDGLYYGTLTRKDTTWQTRRSSVIYARGWTRYSDSRSSLEEDTPATCYSYYRSYYINAKKYVNVDIIDVYWNGSVQGPGEYKFVSRYTGDERIYKYIRKFTVAYRRDEFRYTSTYEGTVTARTVPPELTISQPSDNDVYHNQDKINMKGFIKDADAGDKVTIKYSIEGTQHTDQALTLTNMTEIIATGNEEYFEGYVQLDQGIDDGPYILKIWAEDDKGAESDTVEIAINIRNILKTIENNIRKHITTSEESDIALIISYTGHSILPSDANNRIFDQVSQSIKDRNGKLFFIGESGETERYIKDNLASKYGRVGEENTSKIFDYITEENSKLLAKQTNIFTVGEYINYNMVFEDVEKDYQGITIQDKLKNNDVLSANSKKPKEIQIRYIHKPDFFDNAVTKHSRDDGIWHKVSSMQDPLFIAQAGESMRGKWTLFIKGMDATGNQNFDKYSEIKQYDFIIHQKPKAMIQVVDKGNGTCGVTSVSYDNDYMYRANKGITKEKWEYRTLDGNGMLLSDWAVINDIGHFTIDPLVKTEIRLTVTDMGAFEDIEGDRELTDTAIVTIENKANPPQANFNIQVGVNDTQSYPCNGVIYKGNAGHETVQLDAGAVQWNDLLARTGTRSTVWSKDEGVLNAEVPAAANLSTTLTVTNKYGLSANQTDRAAVKHITIANDTANSIIAGTEIRFKTAVDSPQGLVSCTDLDIKLSCAKLGIDKALMNNDGHSRFSLYKDVPNILAGNVPFAVHIYSKRTGELIAARSDSFDIITPLAVTAHYDSSFPANNIPASELFNLVDIATECPINVTDLRMAIYDGRAVVSPEKRLSNPSNVSHKAGDTWDWEDISDYPVPAALPDGNYTIKIIATAENGVTAEWTKALTVNTPIGLSGFINGVQADAEIYADEITTFTFRTAIYPTDVELDFKGTTYSSANGDIRLISNDGTTKIWEMELVVAPATVTDGETGFAAFTALLPSGLSESVNVNYKIIVVKLENLRIFNIGDYNWERTFVYSNGKPTALQQKGIPVKDMPVDVNKQGQGIKLGYAAAFKIDSAGLNKADSTVAITAHYFALDRKNRLHRADIYVEDRDGNYVKLEDSEYNAMSKSILLDASDRHAYESEPSKTNYNTWGFELFLPYSAKVVKQGEVLDLYQDNTFDYRLIVVLDILGQQHSGSEVYDYTDKETEWGTGDGSVYGRNLPTASDLSGKGTNHGEVFWYNLYETLMDDIHLDRRW